MTSKNINYESIKQMAKEYGCKVTDLIALSPNNDPYYIGTDAHIRDAQWFKNIWEQFGYNVRGDIHIRRIHYRLISQNEPVLMPNPKPYENTDQCWAFITQAAKLARWLGYVDPCAFDDRRNGKPEEFFRMPEMSPVIYTYGSLDFGFSLPSFPALPGYSVEGLEPDQPYLLEVWCEKSTMNDVLLPLCQRYGMNLVTGLGELSLTVCLWLVERVKKIRKPCRIFYISDFDPAGMSMPVAVSRKIEKFIDDYGDPDMDIKLIPIALSHEQCIHYKLPRTPIKESELRAGRFEERFGSGATELDALESLHPGELARIIKEHADRYYDHELEQKYFDFQDEIERDLQQTRQMVLMEYSQEIDNLRNEYGALRDEYRERFKSISEKMRQLWQAIREDMGQKVPDLGYYTWPEAVVQGDNGQCLFDSTRNYLEQLEHYKKFQGRKFQVVAGQNRTKRDNVPV